MTTTIRVLPGDCVRAMRLMAALGVQVQAVVCDPPYHLASIVKRFGRTAVGDDNKTGRRAATGADSMARLSRGFMGQTWDGGDVAFRPETWRAAWELLPPGGHLVAFGGTRTYHRMVCAIEDAGFEIRDMVAWVFGSGFPKSHDVSKGIDKAAGATGERVRRIRPGADQNKDGSWEKLTDRTYEPHKYNAGSEDAEQWQGWGTALKPALEPIVLARKPLDGTVAGNVLTHGTGAINVDGCRVGTGDGGMREGEASARRRYNGNGSTNYAMTPGPRGGDAKGRWPANVCHDGSDEVVGAFPDLSSTTGDRTSRSREADVKGTAWLTANHRSVEHLDSGSPARFFYSAKATAMDRHGSKHPTVKPVNLMRWLVRLVTPPGGIVLDPFAGTGTTGLAAMVEGFDAILIEQSSEYLADIRRRVAWANGEGKTVFQERNEGRESGEAGDLLRLMESP